MCRPRPAALRFLLCSCSSELTFALGNIFHRTFGGIEKSILYERALFGTKHLVEQFYAEVCAYPFRACFQVVLAHCLSSALLFALSGHGAPVVHRSDAVRRVRHGGESALL